MDSALRTRLHDLTLEARRLLTSETRDLLEGVYGLHKDGSLEPIAGLPAIQSLDEVRETRAGLERLLINEQAAGLEATEAVERLVREAAFTWLNRLAALKMLEARHLMRPCISRGTDSNGFKLWLTELGHEAELRRYEAGAAPLDTLGEGPRDTAYRHYLLSLCTEMAGQIRVLFDPDTLPGRLFPRPRALRVLLDKVNDDKLADVWAEDETIGWIYQFFNEEEKDAVFGRLNSGQKIRTSEIPAATQLFTPRWIVQALVENSLGRLWLQMHPDSRLREQLASLVPVQDVPRVPLRLAQEITLLDPACGTMHFGLVAFDLLAEIYREELERAGSPGWPRQASVADALEIPAAILEHNLFGIDIDLRAVQLSALTLYLKAKRLNPQAVIRQSNLACADVLLLDGKRLDAFIKEMRFSRPIFERIIRAVWARLRDASQMGSLLRLEQDIRGLVEAERERYRLEGQGRLPFPELRGLFEEEADEEEYWNILEAQILQAFDEFARQQAQHGVDETYFVGEATKGMRLLDFMMRRYDVITTNPPYMTSRNMPPVMNEYLKRNFPTSKSDLYAAFIDRCTELLAPSGRLAMITQQSFMFISSYEGLRVQLADKTAIETMLHVGLHIFAELNSKVVNTAAFILRRETDTTRRANASGVYFRLVRELDAEAKRRGFERAVANLRAGDVSPAVYRYRQSDFAAISGAPWVYWITSDLRRLFQTLPKLEEISAVCIGMRTGGNPRFLRYWWEVGVQRIGLSCVNAQAAQGTNKRWIPYMKGGDFCRWWGDQEYVVEWYQNGAVIKENTKHNYPQLGENLGWKISNEEYYFRRGVTWTDLTSARFSARLSPGGFIFDVAGSSAFPTDIPLVLAVMNSTLAQYILKLINPTLHVQVGDLKRLPMPTAVSETLHTLVERAVALARADSSEDETTYEFVAPSVWLGGVEDVAERARSLTDVERAIDEEIYHLYGISAEDRQAVEAELAEPSLNEAGDEADAAPVDDEAGPGANGDEPIAPASAPGAGGLSHQALAARWVSYAVGIVLGRFRPGESGTLGCGPTRLQDSLEISQALRALAVPDGLAVLDPGHSEDLVARVERALELLVGEGQVESLLAAATGGRPLGEWLPRDYFKQHLRQYRKRPIYWLLQSPKKRYSFLLFHERITRDTLYLLQGNRYLGGRINHVRSEAQARREAKDALPPGVERRRVERELEALEGELADLEAFAKTLAAITLQPNTRGAVVGWAPEPDDGVLINLAPLHALLPAWSTEAKQYWQALERGDYDWSHTAMRYWPDRVLTKCQTNTSFALAHGVV